MVLDYQAHPAELSHAGQIQGRITVDHLRKAIPEHCFRPLYRYALYYAVRDLTLVFGSMGLAFYFIPEIDSAYTRWTAWLLYGFVEGILMTGLWVLGHECGHAAFSPSEKLNHTVGFTFHSILLTPYFAWRSSHRRHHIYANNLLKDHNYVPPQREEYLASLLFQKVAVEVEELTEDAPIVTLLRIILQQVIGWPYYLLTNITAAEGSLPDQAKTPRSRWLGFFTVSHWYPWSSLFRKEEVHLILASDVGVGAAVLCLFFAAQRVGWPLVFLLYFQPYMWLNHWIVAITYLHHTHPKVPKYENEAWSFIRGATATVDRDFGFIGKHLMHNIIEYHVVHHLFPRMPFYYGEEATKAIRPLLGNSYHEDKNRAYLPAIWESFTKCQWVEPDKPDAPAAERTMWYRGAEKVATAKSSGIRV